jgi:hypothetical protein
VHVATIQFATILKSRIVAASRNHIFVQHDGRAVRFIQKISTA